MGDALKGVMTRAHCDQVRAIVSNLVERHQFGMMKGGYEKGGYEKSFRGGPRGIKILLIFVIQKIIFLYEK